MSVNGDYIGATHLAQVLSFRSKIDKKVKVEARTAANLNQEPGNIDPLALSIDPLDKVSVKLGGSENVDLKMSRSLFLPAGPKTGRNQLHHCLGHRHYLPDGCQHYLLQH